MTVTRWKKYGHERLYVSTETGQRVGWLDLKTGSTTLEQPELASRTRGHRIVPGRRPVHLWAMPSSSV